MTAARCEPAARAGGSVCRAGRGRVTLAGVTRDADGTAAYPEDAQRPWAVCGQIPQAFIEVVEMVVETLRPRN